MALAAVSPLAGRATFGGEEEADEEQLIGRIRHAMG